MHYKEPDVDLRKLRALHYDQEPNQIPQLLLDVKSGLLKDRTSLRAKNISLTVMQSQDGSLHVQYGKTEDGKFLKGKMPSTYGGAPMTLAQDFPRQALCWHRGRLRADGDNVLSRQDSYM